MFTGFVAIFIFPTVKDGVIFYFDLYFLSRREAFLPFCRKYFHDPLPVIPLHNHKNQIHSGRYNGSNNENRVCFKFYPIGNRQKAQYRNNLMPHPRPKAVAYLNYIFLFSIYFSSEQSVSIRF